MINTVSQTFKDIVQGDGRTFRSKIVINGTEYTEFRELRLTKRCEASSSLSFGSTASSQLDVTIADVPKDTIFNGQQLKYYVGLKIDDSLDTFDDDSVYEWVKLGVFNIQKSTFNDNDLTFSAYDNMYLCEQGFFSDLTGLQKVKTIVDEQCTKLGIAYIDDTEDVSYNIDVLKGLTIRESFGYLASFLGRNAIFNEEGQLQFIWYTGVDYTIEGNKFSSPLSVGDIGYNINGLQCITKTTEINEDGIATTKDETISVGNDEFIKFSNLYMTQERLQILLNRIKGMEIRECSLNWTIADPRVQVGDIISIKDIDNTVYSVPIMEMELNVDGGCYGTIKSKYQSNDNSSNTFQGSLAQQVQRTYSELGSFKEIIADKVTAFNSKFNQVDTDILNVNNELSAVKGTINDLDVGTLKADISELKKVTITRQEVEESYIKHQEVEEEYVKKLYADETYSKRADIVNLNVKYAEIEDALIEKLNVRDAEIKYANIDFSNIGEAAIEKIFTDSGIIKDLIVSEGKITGELVGVTIKGDLIEGNTIVADKLVVKGEDGLFYKLNTDGVTTTAEQTEYNSLNGTVITAKSITAEKVAVDDLVAFDATIGGFNISDDAIYSGVKSSINNTTAGIYIGSDGQLYIGDGTNRIRFFKSAEDGKWKLDISAETIRFGSNNTNIEEAIEQLKDEITTSLYISSSRGTVFKESISTVLSVTVYRGSERITDMTSLKLVMGDNVYLQWSFQRMDDETIYIIDSSDIRITNDGFNFTVSPDDVDAKATFFCDLIADQD